MKGGRKGVKSRKREDKIIRSEQKRDRSIARWDNAPQKKSPQRKETPTGERGEKGC